MSTQCGIKCHRKPSGIGCCTNKWFFDNVCCGVDDPSQSGFTTHAVFVHGTRRDTERVDDSEGHTLLDPARWRSVAS